MVIGNFLLFFVDGPILKAFKFVKVEYIKTHIAFNIFSPRYKVYVPKISNTQKTEDSQDF